VKSRRCTDKIRNSVSTSTDIDLRLSFNCSRFKQLQTKIFNSSCKIKPESAISKRYKDRKKFTVHYVIPVILR